VGGDLIIGKNGVSAIATLVERTTRYLILLHLRVRRTADTLLGALASAMNDLPQHLCRSITWDQGKEISLDREFTEGFGNTGLFLPPSLPWERGSNQRPPISRHCCDDQSNPPWQEPGPGGPITMAGDSGWVEDKVRLGLVVGAAVSSTP